jgi:hypothetical protein
MKTRQQYDVGTISHQEYFSQYTVFDPMLFLNLYPLWRVRKGDLTEEEWESAAVCCVHRYQIILEPMLHKNGDVFNQANMICIVKEMARILAEEGKLASEIAGEENYCCYSITSREILDALDVNNIPYLNDGGWYVVKFYVPKHGSRELPKTKQVLIHYGTALSLDNRRFR